MSIMYKIKHYTNRVLYTFLGPADLDDHNDPSLRLKREYEEKQKGTAPTPETSESEALPAQRGGDTKAIA